MPATSEIRFRSFDGQKMRAALALPDGEGPHPGLLVIHEIYGLNDDIRRIAGRFAEHGYAALAPDLYDRPGPRAFCVARAVAALRLKTGQALSDLEAAREYLADCPDVDGDRLGVVGFCMGGGFALLTAVQAPYRVAAPFYGDVPKDARHLEGVCPVVASFGGRDKIFGPQGRRLEEHLERLDVPHDVKVYPDAGHSFMSQHPPSVMIRLGARGPMKAGYNEVAAEDAWRRMLDFFSEHLRG